MMNQAEVKTSMHAACNLVTCLPTALVELKKGVDEAVTDVAGVEPLTAAVCAETLVMIAADMEQKAKQLRTIAEQIARAAPQRWLLQPHCLQLGLSSTRTMNRRRRRSLA